MVVNICNDKIENRKETKITLFKYETKKEKRPMDHHGDYSRRLKTSEYLVFSHFMRISSMYSCSYLNEDTFIGNQDRKREEILYNNDYFKTLFPL